MKRKDYLDRPRREVQTERRLEQQRKWRLRFGYLSDLEVSRMQRGQLWTLWPEEESLWVQKVTDLPSLYAITKE